MRCESEAHRRSGPPAFAHCSLPLAARAQPSAGGPGPWYRSAPATPSLRSVAASAPLVLGSLNSADGRPCSAPSPCSLFLDWWDSDARDFVTGSSSPAALSRSSQTVTRTARRCWLGLLPHAYSPGECPEGRTGRHPVPITRQPLSGSGKADANTISKPRISFRDNSLRSQET